MKKSKQRMKRIAKSLLSVGLFLCAASVHADFIVDTKYNGASKNANQMTWNEQQQLRTFDAKWDKNILQAIAEENEGIAPTSTPSGNGKSHILWNGKHYYAWAVNYLSAVQDRELDSAIATKRKSVAIPGGGICAVYVFDQDLNKLTSLRIDLPENNRGTWCNGIYGFGGAGKSVDGVLVTLSYYLAGNKPAQQPADIGKGWRYMTALVRFEEKDGKLTLKQDDSCLGNPNSYSTIAAARKELAQCSARKP